MLLTGRVGAQMPLPADGLFSARGHMTYLIDTSGQRTMHEVLGLSAMFKPVAIDIPQFDACHQAHWLRTRVVNATTHAAPFVGEIDYPFLGDNSAGSLTGGPSKIRQMPYKGWLARQ